MSRSATILKPDNQRKVHFENGKTVDIQSVIFSVNAKEIWKQTETFSKQFSKDYEGLRLLREFVVQNIEYQEDPIGFQYVQHPAALWASKLGDCKSMTLFIVSVLQNMGIPYLIRFTAYKRGDVTHVYPVAILDGQEIILDAVWDYFDDEKEYYRKEDFKFQKDMSQIVEISGYRIGVARSVSDTAAAFHAATKDIPDSILNNDITEMSQAEFYKWMGYSITSGIGSMATTRAFVPPTLEFDSVGNLIGISFESAKRFIKKTATKVKETVVKAKDAVVNAAKAVAEKLKEGWKKLVNWVFKTALPVAAPFFLYTFLKKSMGTKIDAKKDRQEKVIHWISTISGTPIEQLQAAIRAGIAKKLGKQPEVLLNEAAKATIAGHRVGFVQAVLAALPMLLELIKKIGQLFGKSTPDVSSNDAGNDSEIRDASASEDIEAPAGESTNRIQIPIPSPANPDGDPNRHRETEQETNSYDAVKDEKQVPPPNAPEDNSTMKMVGAALLFYFITQN